MPTSSQPTVEVFYDGDCPLCRREIDMLRRWDKHQRILFTDIAEESFDPALLGKTHSELMAQIHGRLPTGEWIIGVEVFRQLYSAVGLGWIVRWTRLPIVRQILDAAYQFFARYRLRLTGRCETGSCSLPKVPAHPKSSA
jgi:predicted DCC family thiol-disulfide oxidoreductase YuxK